MHNKEKQIVDDRVGERASMNLWDLSNILTRIDMLDGQLTVPEEIESVGGHAAFAGQPQTNLAPLLRRRLRRRRRRTGDFERRRRGDGNRVSEKEGAFGWVCRQHF